MDRTPSPAHASHDELLIARLYGGDVDAGERARAVGRIAECADCADLYADLAAIADAQASTVTPTRPRDFSLTEADAVRLRRKRRAAWLFGGDLRRALGGSLAALAVIGVVLTGVASIFGGSTTSDRMTLQAAGAFGPNAAASGDQSAAYGGLASTAGPAASAGSVANNGSVATPVPAATPAPAASELAAATQLDLTAATPAAGRLPSPAGTVPAPPPVAAPSPTGDLAKVAQSSAEGAGAGQPPTVPPAASTSGEDPRTVWLAGLGVLFVIGLAIAALPRRRRRGPRQPS